MPGVVNATNMTRYENLTNTDIETLLQDGPLAVAVFANAGFMSYTSGVYTGCPDSATSISSINHAVIVVGMDANKNYIIKNSWGTGWGESGFATISAANDCGINRWIYQYTWGYQIMGTVLLSLIAIIFVMFWSLFGILFLLVIFLLFWNYGK